MCKIDQLTVPVNDLNDEFSTVVVAATSKLQTTDGISNSTKTMLADLELNHQLNDKLIAGLRTKLSTEKSNSMERQSIHHLF